MPQQHPTLRAKMAGLQQVYLKPVTTALATNEVMVRKARRCVCACTSSKLGCQDVIR